MNNRPAAAEESGDFADTLPFAVQPRRLGALVRAQLVLPAGVDATLLRIGHAGLDAFTDQFALEFRDLHHHAEHQASPGVFRSMPRVVMTICTPRSSRSFAVFRDSRVERPSRSTFQTTKLSPS